LAFIKSKLLNSIGLETFWVAIGVGGSVIAMMIGVRLLTTILSPDEYGLLALGASLGMALKNSIGFGLNNSATRFYSIAEKENEFHIYWRCLYRIFIVIVLSSIFLNLIIQVSAVIIKNEELIFWGWSLFWGGLLALDMAMEGPLNGARRRIIFCFHRIFFDFSRFLIAFFLVKIFLPQAYYALFGFVIATSVTITSKFYFINRLRVKTTLLKDKEAFLYRSFSENFYKYFYPTLAIGFFNWIQLFSDRWAINFFRSESEVGIYFALFQIAYSPALILTGFLSNLTGPLLFGASSNFHDNNSQSNAIKMNLILSCILSGFYFIMFFILYVFRNLIGVILLGEEFRSHLQLIPWLFLSGGFYAIGQQLFMIPYMKLNLSQPLLFRAIIAILSLSTISIGSMMHGIIGVTFALFVISLIFYIGAIISCLVFK
jgi:O-antigen/teichoic acid export membrane protein